VIRSLAVSSCSKVSFGFSTCYSIIFKIYELHTLVPKSSGIDCLPCKIFFSSVIEFMSSAMIIAFSFLESDLFMPFNPS